jgi:hypothetical protein
MTKFTLNMGLFDKDTHQQEISILDAYKILSNYLLSKTDGATISEGKGLYKHKDGTVVIEPTMIIDLMFIDRETILEIVDTLKVLFNQESIVVQEYNITSDMI